MSLTVDQCHKNMFLSFPSFDLEEILDAIRIRKGETLEDRSSAADETEKEKDGVENKDNTDTDNGKEELINQQLDVNKETPMEESPKKGRKEGNRKIRIHLRNILAALTFIPNKLQCIANGLALITLSLLTFSYLDGKVLSCRISHHFLLMLQNSNRLSDFHEINFYMNKISHLYKSVLKYI